MKKIITMMLVVTILTGCSAFRPHKESLSIMTNQPDAVIYVNGERLGTGVVHTRVKRSKNVQVVASKPGYHTAYRSIDSNLNITGVLDIIGTILYLIPFVGLLTPGCKSLDETNVALHLDPVKTTSQNREVNTHNNVTLYLNSPGTSEEGE